MWTKYLPVKKLRKKDIGPFIFVVTVLAVIVCLHYYTTNLTLPIDHGPAYVDGWYPNTSKNANDYIFESQQPHIMPKNFCEKGGILLVMVTVRPDDFEVRRVIRETWAEKRDKVSFYFLIGETKPYHNLLQAKLEDESKDYDDVIQERFVDTYNNLTLKSINMLKLFTLHCSKSYKYLMKIDDDVFLNVENVLLLLDTRTSSTHLLVGQIINNSNPVRDPTSKWYVPYELYQEDKYPDYICGGTYLMSSDVAEKLYRCTIETSFLFIEDVYVTGICAKKMNVTPTHDSKFRCQYTNKYICFHRDKYTIHYYEREEMRKAHKLLKNRCPTSGSLMEWMHSLFF